MIDNKLLKAHEWRNFLLKMENGEEAMFKVKNYSHVASIRTVAGRLNNEANRTFRFSVRANRKTNTVYIHTGPNI